MRIGIPREAKGETLVAATPDTVIKLQKLGYEVCIERAAGVAASFCDEQYEAAGASIVSRDEVWQSDIAICLNVPAEHDLAGMHAGSVLMSQIHPASNPELVQSLAAKGITALAMDAIPRISRAQSMDVRSSMANVAGYRAVIEAANAYGHLFSGQVTAAGKMPPARVYIVGVGVAGLAAIGTAGSMGAQVSASDVRSDVADQVESLGGTFVDISVQQESEDGYAKEMSASDQERVLAIYAKQAAENDIVITTAHVPGKPSPLVLTAEAVAGMKPGSVIVDMGANEYGGNCELTQPGEVVVTENGVTIIGYEELQNRLPGQSSQLYGQNIVNFLKLATPAKDGQLVLDEEDDVVRGITVVLDGNIMWPPPAISVSASPAAATSEGLASIENNETASETESKPSWKSWAWKVAAVVLGVALILGAPDEMMSHFIVFELAIVVGFYVITNVTHTLHTPLMSVTNAISGIIIVGALLLVGSSNIVVSVLSFIAIVIASINIFGGFLVTNRMLEMFQRSSEE